MDDHALVAAVARRDPAGLETMYRRYADRLHAYCASIAHDPDIAADAVHDTFLLAVHRIDQLRDPARLRAWLYAIARRECLRLMRTEARSLPLDAAGDVAADTTDPIATVHAEHVRELVRAATDGLSGTDREVVDLTLRHGLTAAELATTLGISANQAHARLSRARNHLLLALGALMLARTAAETSPNHAATV
jgi:RNA polymerase sigma factor (sigma-70 family)